MFEVHFCNNTKPLQFSLSLDKTIEEILTDICKELKITPLYRHLFGLRNKKSNLWLTLNKKLNSLKDTSSCQLRIRFKPYCLELLKLRDIEAFNYYFYQVSIDQL